MRTAAQHRPIPCTNRLQIGVLRALCAGICPTSMRHAHQPSVAVVRRAWTAATVDRAPALASTKLRARVRRQPREFATAARQRWGGGRPPNPRAAVDAPAQPVGLLAGHQRHLVGPGLRHLPGALQRHVRRDARVHRTWPSSRSSRSPSRSSSSRPSPRSPTTPSRAGAGASRTSSSAACSTSSSWPASPPRTTSWPLPLSCCCCSSRPTSPRARSRATCPTSSPSARWAWRAA